MKKHSSTKKVTCFLDLLQEEEVVNLYKHFTGVTQVKFKDRQAAETALLNASFGKHQPQMIAAFKVAGIHQDTVNQYGQMLRGPIAFPEGQMTPKQLKEHTKALELGKKVDTKHPADPKQPNAASAAVLLALREMIPEGAKGDAASVSSADVAEKLNTNSNAVCKAADSLSKQKYIEVEDDSHEEGKTLYWLTLTAEGRDVKVATPSVKLPASNPGPRSNFDGKFIFKISKTNPRREGTHGWKSWEALKDGMTFEEYKRAGGRNNDLQWDVDKGYCSLQESKTDAPAKKDAPAKEPPKPKKMTAEQEMADLREKLRQAEERAGKVVKAPEEAPGSNSPTIKRLARELVTKLTAAKKKSLVKKTKKGSKKK